MAVYLVVDPVVLLRSLATVAPAPEGPPSYTSQVVDLVREHYEVGQTEFWMVPVAGGPSRLIEWFREGCKATYGTAWREKLLADLDSGKTPWGKIGEEM
jgi:hypothetical protein